MTRVVAVGDIHGYLGALQTLVEVADIGAADLLVTLGDYVDRGPDSAGVLDWLCQWSDAGRLVPLRGNHDIMFLDAVAGGEWKLAWPGYGGDATLQSYRDRGIQLMADGIPERHFRFLTEECRKLYVTESHFFVHAMADPDRPFDDQPDWLVYWEKWLDPPPHVSGKTLVCGHTAQKSGLSLSNGHAVCIDTWVYGRGWLTALDVGTGDFWQARENGETRSGRIDALPSARDRANGPG